MCANKQFGRFRGVLMMISILLFSSSFSGCRNPSPSMPLTDPYVRACEKVLPGLDEHYILHDGVFYSFDGTGYYDEAGNYYDHLEGYVRPQSADRDSADRDLISQMQTLESQRIQEAGRRLSKKYGVAEATGIQIAQTLQDYASLGRKRERTPADWAGFSVRLFGVQLSEGIRAMSRADEGDTRALEQVNDAIADHWGTTPETSKQILSDWYSAD